jgi:hypothetical protein
MAAEMIEEISRTLDEADYAQILAGDLGAFLSTNCFLNVEDFFFRVTTKLDVMRAHENIIELKKNIKPLRALAISEEPANKGSIAEL